MLVTNVSSDVVILRHVPAVRRAELLITAAHTLTTALAAPTRRQSHPAAAHLVRRGEMERAVAPKEVSLA
jgi:hypothetical protein